jgi:hypothetical protein
MLSTSHFIYKLGATLFCRYFVYPPPQVANRIRDLRTTSEVCSLIFISGNL